jgi:phytoene synthase
MGVRSPAALSRACDLGVAMQLTNIARDVGEDARAGRLYLPLDWMREAGLEPAAWLAAPEFGPQIASVIQRVLEEADRLYARARPGIALLPMGCRPAIHAAARIYREIGAEAERAGWDTVNRRVVTSTGRKLSLAAAGLLDAALTRGDDDASPLAETRFLVYAIPPVPPLPPAPPWWRVDEHWGRMIEILLALELREQESTRLPDMRRERQG